MTSSALKLPPDSAPLDCKGNWSNTVADVNKTANMQDPLARNQKITASYATMYKQDPSLKWAGLGAIVSRNAGFGMVKAQSAADESGQAIMDQNQYAPEPSADPYNTGRGYSAQVAHDALADTNQLIYRTVAPTMSFISKYGAKQLKGCMQSGAIPVENHLGDKVPNDKVPNDAVPAQLTPAVDKLAQAEDLSTSETKKAILNGRAADDIASYEQLGVVQQRIYDPSWTVRKVFRANQWLSQKQWGRDMGAVAPEVALSADCNSTDRIPFRGSLENPADRVIYYKQLMTALNKTDPSSVEHLMDQLETEHTF